MADANGVKYTKVATGPTPANNLVRAELGEKVRCLVDTYEASALGSGSTIAMGKDLKAGDRIVGGYLAFDALGGSSTLSLGDANTADLYISATSSASAGNATTFNVDGIDYVIGTNDDDETILVTTGGAAITGTLKMVLYYVSA